MKRLASVICLGLLCALSAMGQATQGTQNSVPAIPETQNVPTPAPQSRKKFNATIPARFELSGGYSYRAYSPNSSTTLKLNGVYASGEYNIFSWVGVAVEGTATARKQGVASLGTSQTLGIFSVMAGPQFYPIRHRRFTLFGHILAGEGFYALSTPAYGGFPSKLTTSMSTTFEAGVGVDFRASKRWEIRLGEGDYGETGFSTGNPHQDNYRVASGVVYLIGQK